MPRWADMAAEQGRRVRVDWPRCAARGLCAELLPEVIDLDRWGYPIVVGEVPRESLEHARRAARACPRSALRLT